jgi:hypothetical protein
MGTRISHVRCILNFVRHGNPAWLQKLQSPQPKRARFEWEDATFSVVLGRYPRVVPLDHSSVVRPPDLISPTSRAVLPTSRSAAARISTTTIEGWCIYILLVTPTSSSISISSSSIRISSTTRCCSRITPRASPLPTIPPRLLLLGLMLRRRCAPPIPLESVSPHRTTVRFHGSDSHRARLVLPNQNQSTIRTTISFQYLPQQIDFTVPSPGPYGPVYSSFVRPNHN